MYFYNLKKKYLGLIIIFLSLLLQNWPFYLYITYIFKYFSFIFLSFLFFDNIVIKYISFNFFSFALLLLLFVFFNFFIFYWFLLNIFSNIILILFIKPEGNSPSNADKSPVERLSLNRSQCGGCSTKYNTLTET